ncbi:hypothetical protein Bra1253DRAFT_05955 [Bradyrhizobium sp. WSM1253]|nr:hypothetical protein Bra1253DRAFT_05955 [Bradyrhizobium sp. WSM1253]
MAPFFRAPRLAARARLASLPTLLLKSTRPTTMLRKLRTCRQLVACGSLFMKRFHAGWQLVPPCNEEIQKSCQLRAKTAQRPISAHHPSACMGVLQDAAPSTSKSSTRQTRQFVGLWAFPSLAIRAPGSSKPRRTVRSPINIAPRDSLLLRTQIVVSAKDASRGEKSSHQRSTLVRDHKEVMPQHRLEDVQLRPVCVNSLLSASRIVAK